MLLAGFLTYLRKGGRNNVVFKWQKKQQPKRSSAPLTPWEQEQQRRQARLKAEQKKGSLRPVYDQNLPKLKKKRKQRLKKHEKVLLTIFTTIAMVTLYFILPFSRVTSVKINNTYPESKDEILQATGLRYYESLFVVWPKAEQIKQQVKQKVPSVKTVEVLFQGSHITINAKEYPMVGYFKKGSHYYRLTSFGAVSIQELKSTSGKYPVFYGFRKAKVLKMTAQKYMQLPAEIKQGISEIHAIPSKVDPQKIKLYMNDGNQVIAKASTFGQKMKYYSNISANMEKPGIVDLEVGAYSYPYGKK